MVRNFPGNGLVSFPKSVGYKIEQLNGLPLISARANIQNVPVPRGHFFSILYENILFSIFRTVWRTNTKSLEPTVFVSSCKENDDKLTRQLTEFSRSVIGQESLSLRKLSIFRNRKKNRPLSTCLFVIPIWQEVLECKGYFWRGPVPLISTFRRLFAPPSWSQLATLQLDRENLW